MLVELDKTDLVRLVKGYEPDYSQTDERYGTYCGGFNDYWTWDIGKLHDISEEDLWDFYQNLKNPVQKTVVINGHRTVKETKEEIVIREIAEIQEILEDGVHRGNQGQVDAALEELERLRNE